MATPGRLRSFLMWFPEGGFLGAGVIMKNDGNVWGLNTAATLWCSAAVGACAGADLAAEAVTLTCFVLVGNTLLRPLVNAINRALIKESATEAIYEVRLTVAAEHVEEAREHLQTQLESANYPIRNINIVEREDGTVELVATLLGTTADPNELDAVIASFTQSPFAQHSSWSLRTAD